MKILIVIVVINCFCTIQPGCETVINMCRHNWSTTTVLECLFVKSRIKYELINLDKIYHTRHNNIM